MNRPTRLLPLATLLFIAQAIPLLAQERAPTPEPSPAPAPKPAPEPVRVEPVILQLESHEGPPGAVIVILGRGFGENAELVQAELGGKSCAVIEVHPEQIILVSDPETRPARSSLILSIDRKKLEAQTYEVLDPAKIGPEYWKKQFEKYEAAARRDEETERREAILVDRFELVRDASGRVGILVAGRTKDLIDGCKLHLRLEHADETVGLETAIVGAGRFQTQFGPYDRRLFPGRYVLELRFLLHKQMFSLRKQLESGKDERKLESLRRLSFRDFYDIGSNDEWVRERDELAKVYDDGLKDIEARLSDFQALYAATLRCVFRKGKELDEAAWSEWVKSHELIANEAELAAARKDNRALKGEHFDPIAWEKLVTDLLLALEARQNAVFQKNKGFVTVPWSFLQGRYEVMTSILVGVIWVRTAFLHSRYKLKISDTLLERFNTIRTVSGVEGGTGTVRSYAEKIREFLAEQRERDRSGSPDAPRGKAEATPPK